MKALLVFALVIAAVIVTGAQANGSVYSPGLDSWNGVVSPNGQIRFVTLWSGSKTVVAGVRVHGGRVVASNVVRGQYGVPIVAYDGTTGGVSGDGRALVIGSYGPQPGTPGSTRFALLNARTLRLKRTFELPGTWSYDAVSPDASVLYLVQHVSMGKNPRYRVRAFDVHSGRLLPRPIVDTKENAALMRGQPATRVANADGRWAYTLYARAKDEPFVHALDTERKQAYCIDLPLELRQQEQMTLRLRLDADGRTLTVRSGGEALAEVDTRSFAVRASD